jgi:hypothetical protein
MNCFDWNMVMALCTIVIAIYGICQYRLSRINGQRQLRAYVFVEPQSPKDILGVGPNHFGGVVMKNSGQTPAYKVSAWINSEVRETCDGNFQEGEFRPYPPIHMGGSNLLLETDGMNSGSKNPTVYYWGVIRYFDVFGKPHHTAFRFATRWEGDPAYGDKFDYWSIPIPCPEGNHVDYD